MLVDNSHCAKDRRLNNPVRVYMHGGVIPCLIAPNGAQGQQEQQSEQQQQQQQVRLAQHFLAVGEQRDKT